MGTRPGDLDAGVLLRLARARGSGIEALESYLYTECGLRGLAQMDGDVRRLLEAESVGDAAARTALDAYVYRVRKYIGAYAVVLGGIDALVFTGTVGERSSVMRERIARGLDIFGL